MHRLMRDLGSNTPRPLGQHTADSPPDAFEKQTSAAIPPPLPKAKAVYVSDLLQMDPLELSRRLQGPQAESLITYLAQNLRPADLCKVSPDSLRGLRQVFEKTSESFKNSTYTESRLKVITVINRVQERREDLTERLKRNIPVGLDVLIGLFELGVDINTRFPLNNYQHAGMSLAQAALMEGNTDIFNKLREKGAVFTQHDANARFPGNQCFYRGMSLAQVALMEGNTDIFNKLREEGAIFTSEDANARFPNDHPNSGMSLAQVALMEGNTDIFNKLREEGAIFTREDANARFPNDHPNYPGMSLAQVALAANKIDAFNKLLEMGADANASFPDKHAKYPGMSLAQVALVTNNIDTLKKLLKVGADPNTSFPDKHQNYPGMRLIQVALLINNMTAFDNLRTKWVIFTSEDANARFPDDHSFYPGMSLLQVALIQGNINIFNKLREEGAIFTPEDVGARFPDNSRQYPGMTLAQVALVTNNIDALKQLLEIGADANASFPDKHENYPGMSLAQVILDSGNDELMRILLSHVELSDLSNISEENQIRARYQMNPGAFELPAVNDELVVPLTDGLSINDMTSKVSDEKWLEQFFGPSTGTFEFKSDQGTSYTRSQVIDGLKKLLDGVKQRNSFLGTPRSNEPEKLKQYWDRIFHRLQHVFSCLDNEKIDNELKQAALGMIFNGSTNCGTAWYNEVKSAYQLLRSKLPFSPAQGAEAENDRANKEREDEVRQVLYHFRKRCFITSLPNNDTHTYNQYMRDLGREFGVASEDSSYDDPIANPLFEYEKAHFRQQMKALYNPLEIVAELHRVVRDRKQISTGTVPALLADYGPRVLTIDQQKELRELENTLKNEIVLTGDDFMRLTGMNRAPPTDERGRQEHERLKVANEQKKHAMGLQYEALNKLNAEQEVYLKKTLEQDGDYLPSKAGISHLLAKMGIFSEKDVSSWQQQDLYSPEEPF